MAELPSLYPETTHTSLNIKERWIVSPEGKKEALKDMPEMLRIAIDIAMKRVLQKINSQEGLRTDPHSYCTEVIGVLKEMDVKLPENNILKGTSELIINNYFKPEEKWVEFIKSILQIGEKWILEKKSIKIGPKEFDSWMQFLRSSLGFVIDLAQTKPEKIPALMKEFLKNEQVKNILVRFPDIEVLFTKILPELAKNIDKWIFLAAFDAFITNIRSDTIQLFWSSLLDENKQGEIVLKIANESAKFTANLLNKDTVKTAIWSFSELPSVNSNPIAKTLFSLIQREELSDKDRLNIVQQANTGLILLTKNPRPTEKELEDYINTTVSLLSHFTEKLPKVLVAEKIAELFPIKKGESNSLKIKNTSDLAVLLWNNKAKLIEAMSMYLRWKLDNIKDIITFVLDDHLITDNIEYTKWHLIEHLKNIVNIDLSSFATQIRGKLSQDLKTNNIININNLGVKTGNILGDRIAENLSTDILLLFFSESRPKAITKETFVIKTIASIHKTVTSFPSESIQIKDGTGKEFINIPKSTLLAIVESEPFKAFIDGSFLNISQDSLKSKDIMKNILQIVEDIKKDPLGNKYTWEQTKQAAIDSFYNLSSNELAKTVHGNIEIMGLGDSIKDKNGTFVFNGEDIKILIETLREHIPKALVEKILNNNKTPPIDVRKVIMEIFQCLSSSTIKEVSEVLIGKWILSKVKNVVPVKWWELTQAKMNELLQMIFLAKWKTSPEVRTDICTVLWINGKNIESAIILMESLGEQRVKELAEKHLNIINGLISGDINPLTQPEKFSGIITDILYSFDSGELQKIGGKIRNIFPEIENILSMKIGGENIITQIEKVRNVIPKASMQTFLEKNATKLAWLAMNQWQTKDMIDLWWELFLLIPREKLMTLFDKNKLSETEKFVVENLPNIQKIILKLKTEQKPRFDKITELLGNTLDKKITDDNAKFFAGETYEIIGELISSLGSEWKIPNSESDGDSAIKSAFIKNNLSFIISQVFPYLLGRSKEVIVSQYFTDTSNKGNFISMVSPIFSQKT